MDGKGSDGSRRGFLRTTSGAAAAALAGPMLVPRGAFGAGDRIRAAVLGVNGRGKGHIEGLMALPNVEVVTLCDPDSQVAAQRAKEFEAKYGKAVKTEKDLRKVYDDKEVDVVSIATPNHWHALATIWACQAGKDVYVEKPGSHNICEGRKMVEAARKHGRIVQNGVQLRSSAAIQEAVQHLRSGTIGKRLHGPRPRLPLAPRHRPQGDRACPLPPRLRPLAGARAGAAVQPGHRPLQLALDLGVRQRRRRQPGHPRDGHVPVGPRRGRCPRRSPRWAASSCSTTTRRRRRSSRPPTTTRRRRR